MRGSSLCSCFSPFRLCWTLWPVARQAPLSMGFSRQESWGGLPYPSPGALPDGSNPHLLCPMHWQAGSLLLELPGNGVSGSKITTGNLLRFQNIREFLLNWLNKFLANSRPRI